ncbi:MAG: putative ABC transporter ATP-binding protein YknY [Chlamydiales bacterium]|nr:putative ABC transporter ATP-binding protein YknY [Chlamydiales bacterium]MCH9636205.1 putative ABC transporter ATP-binding protein YknY [Chlamydiales bacterium]MCH9703358.1 ABC transporter ATP-binding protein [Chlamydiota bacterium]
MNVAIACKGLKKHYGKKLARVDALRGVTFESHMGELLMIVGPSGCGKTTLLSIISTILDQSEGECLLFGKDVNALPDDEKVAYRGKQIGFIFQNFNLIPMLTALENAALPLVINGEDKERALDYAKGLLVEVGLEKRIDAYPKQMSGGEQQRVAIVRGCIHNPKIIVCDEPTSALDHKTGAQVMELFQKLARRHKSSLVIVTHDARIFDFADRILEMEDGRIIRHKQNGGTYV